MSVSTHALDGFQLGNEDIVLRHRPWPYRAALIALLVFLALVLMMAVTVLPLISGDGWSSISDFSATFLLSGLLLAGLIAVLLWAIRVTWRCATLTARPGAWYLCLRPDAVAIHVRHYLDLDRLPRNDHTVAVVPADDIRFVRRSLWPTADSEENDLLCVDLALSETAWSTVYRLCVQEQERRTAAPLDPEDLVLTFFEDDILRIRLDAAYDWPEALARAWQVARYPVAPDYTAPEENSWEAGTTGPRAIPLRGRI